MPAPTFGFFAVVSAGGQFDAHAPEQRLLFFRSCPKAYSVRPFESTRIFPRLELCTASARPWVAAAAVALPSEPQPASAIGMASAARGRRSGERFMPGYTAEARSGFGAACVRLLRASVDGDQVHDEHECLVGADHATRSALAVRELRRD